MGLGSLQQGGTRGLDGGNTKEITTMGVNRRAGITTPALPALVHRTGWRALRGRCAPEREVRPPCDQCRQRRNNARSAVLLVRDKGC